MSSDPYIGRKLGNYDIIRLIGRGGMAGVYEANQPSLNRTVAIKLMAQSISEDPSFVQRFQIEAKTITRLEHAHILPVYDFGQEGDALFIVMRYLDAGTLEDRIKPGGMDLKEAVDLFSQLASALDYAHSKGVIHRDLKPSNVLVDRQGSAYLSDFGIAKSLEAGTQNLTGTGGVVGTPTYMSPEQGLGGELDGRSDIYALGVILFEMLTGKVPFTGDNPMQVMLKHINDMPPFPSALNPAVTPAIESVVMRALAKEKESRFATARDMSSALQDAYEKGKTVNVEPFSTIPVTAAGGSAGPGSVTMPAPVAGLGQPGTAGHGPAGAIPGFAGQPGTAAPGMVSTAGMPSAAGTPAAVATAPQPEVPYYTINGISEALSERTWVGRWLQAGLLSLSTLIALNFLTPGDIVQNVVLALVPGAFFYGLLNAPLPGGLIAMGLLFLPLLAHAPMLGLLWLMGIAVAGLQMTSREMMLTMATLIGAGTPLGWLIPLAAPWWLRSHRVAFAVAVGVIFAGLFAVTLNGWPNAGGLIPTPRPDDALLFKDVQISKFDTSYLGLLDPKVWEPWYKDPQSILENIRGGIQTLGSYYLSIKVLPLIVAAAWAVASFVSTLWRTDSSLLMRGLGIAFGALVLVFGHMLHSLFGVQQWDVSAFAISLSMAVVAFLLCIFPLQAPAPPRAKKRAAA